MITNPGAELPAEATGDKDVAGGDGGRTISLSVGALVGIIIGCLACLLLAVLAGVVLCRRRRRPAPTPIRRSSIAASAESTVSPYPFSAGYHAADEKRRTRWTAVSSSEEDLSSRSDGTTTSVAASGTALSAASPLSYQTALEKPGSWVELRSAASHGGSSESPTVVPPLEAPRASARASSGMSSILSTYTAPPAYTSGRHTPAR